MASATLEHLRVSSFAMLSNTSQILSDFLERVWFVVSVRVHGLLKHTFLEARYWFIPVCPSDFSLDDNDEILDTTDLGQKGLHWKAKL